MKIKYIYKNYNDFFTDNFSDGQLIKDRYEKNDGIIVFDDINNEPYFFEFDGENLNKIHTKNDISKSNTLQIINDIIDQLEGLKTII